MDYIITLDHLSVVTAAFYVVLVFIVALGGILVKPILFPPIIAFPWQDSDGTTQKLEETVILAGSYNPPHLGHLAMLQYLSRRYKRVIAVVGFNPNKKYLVSPEQRRGLLEKMIQSTAADNIDVAVVDGYIWRYGKKEGVGKFFRGIRTWEKDGGDERALQILNTWGPLLLGPLFWPIPTNYLEGDPRYNHVSSTLIRNLCSNVTAKDKKALSELVPDNVVDEVSELYGRKDD